MKKHLALVLLVFICVIAFGQSNYQDVVYLKNGSIIRGIVIEQIPNKSLKIETSDKSVFVYQMDEIEKITKEQVLKNKEYSGNNSEIQTENKETGKSIQRFGIGVSGTALMPVGSFGDMYDFGSGFGAKIFLNSSDGGKKESAFGISTGFAKFQSQEFSSFSGSIIPIVLFSEDYFGKGIVKGVWGIELGGYNFKTDGTYYGYNVSESKMKFGSSFYLGTLLDLSKNLTLIFDAKYSHILDFKNFADSPSWIGINMGLNYKFGPSNEI